MRHLLTDLRGNPISFASRRRQRRYRHPHLPTLFYLVQNRTWDGVVRRARTHAHEIVIQEEVSGNTPLHIACRLDPPSEAVRALLRASEMLNAEGATALHVAATHRCSPEVISALLRPTDSLGAGKNSYSRVSTTAILTKTGRAPIHYACMSFRGLGVEAFRVLLEATIQRGYVSLEDNDDDYFRADDEDDEDKSTPPLEKDVNVMTMQDCSGETPLGLLFRRYRERVRCVIKALEKIRKEGSSTAASLAAALKVQSDLGELWEKARLIVGKLTEERLQREGDKIIDIFNLEAASPAEAAVAHEAAAWAAERHRRSLRQEQPSQFTAGGPRKFRVVHASVGLAGYGCPWEMILLAISMHPNQVNEMDEDGNLPLHIAAVASSYLTTHSNTNQPRLLNGSDEDSMVSEISFLSNVATCREACFDKVIKILLKHYPAAARIPHGQSGRLPLVLAIDAGRRSWDDGIKSLLDAYPPAVESRHIRVQLYPAILALLGRSSSRSGVTKSNAPSWKRRFSSSGRKQRASLTSLFELVKAKPEIVQEAKGEAI